MNESNSKRPIEDRQALDLATDCLNAGGLIAFPTETFYGLGARIDKPSAMVRLSRLKQRALPFSLVVAGVADLERFSLVAPAQLDAVRVLADLCWPGPITLVCDAAKGVHSALVGPDGGVAVRQSPHALLVELLGLVGCPITATSANRKGEPPPATPAHIAASGLDGELDFILDGGQTPGESPSTLLRLKGQRRCRILRPGQVSFGALRQLLESTDFQLER